MRRSPLAFAFAAVLLAGCPQPEEGTTTDASPIPPPVNGGPGAPPADGAGAPAGDPNGGAAPAGDPNAAPAGDPNAASAPPQGDGAGPMPAPGLASLVKDGKTVTLKGTLKGATTAQVDITEVMDVDGRKAPQVIESIKVTDGTFSVQAPATYDKPLYAVALHDITGDGPSKDDLGGTASSPIQLDGKDVSIEITLTEGEGWMKALPWFAGTPAAPPPPPPAGAKGIPGGGAAADGAPPVPPPAGTSTDASAPGSASGTAPGATTGGK